MRTACHLDTCELKIVIINYVMCTACHRDRMKIVIKQFETFVMRTACHLDRLKIVIINIMRRLLCASHAM